MLTIQELAVIAVDGLEKPSNYQTSLIYHNIHNHNALWDELDIYKKSKQKKYYYYLITFTLKEDTNDEEKIHQYIKKQLQRKALKIVEAHLAKEYTKKGRPHWHASVKSEKYLAKDRFNYFVKKYGNIDISKNNSQTLEESINYINKSTTSEQIV